MEANPEPTIEQALQELSVAVDEGTAHLIQLFSRDTTFRLRRMTTRRSVI
jgi:hypothetical protein